MCFNAILTSICNPFSFNTPNNTISAPVDSFISRLGAPVATAAVALKGLCDRAVQWMKDTWRDASSWARSYLGQVDIDKTARPSEELKQEEPENPPIKAPSVQNESTHFNLERLSQMSASKLRKLPDGEPLKLLHGIVQDQAQIDILEEWARSTPEKLLRVMLAKAENGSTLMHVAMMHPACITALSPALTRLLEGNYIILRDLMRAKDSQGFTPMHYAMAKPERIDALSTLLANFQELCNFELQELMQQKAENSSTPASIAGMDPARKIALPFSLDELMSSTRVIF